MYCAYCGKEGNKRCSRCKSVVYCSSDCQKAHWKQHKGECKYLSKSSTSNKTISELEEEIRVLIQFI